MFWIGFGIYTCFIVLIFSFFIVAKIHTYKFRCYSTHIVPVTRLLGTVLVILALFGYYILFSESFSLAPTTMPIETTSTTEIY